MELRWGGRAALLLGAMVLLTSAAGAEIAPVLKAGETPASALEAVSVSARERVHERMTRFDGVSIFSTNKLNSCDFGMILGFARKMEFFLFLSKNRVVLLLPLCGVIAIRRILTVMQI